ncbi:MAG TPA: hypothetical protein PKH51_10850 [Candidatus Sumerlaeota bacterium]|nr:hypothetical protein [Candidatus Sumerlaeota bacterium]
MTAIFVSLAIPCAMSEEGEADLPHCRGRRGYVVGQSRDRRCWRVRFPLRKHPQNYHKSYIRMLVPAFEEGVLDLNPHVHDQDRSDSASL